MKDSTKKWLTIAGGLVVCALLVFVIARQFSNEKITDELPPPSSSLQSEVVIDPDSSNSATTSDSSSNTSEEDLTVKPQTMPDNTESNAGNGAVSSGTEQTIQADPEVPEEPTEEVLTDPSKMPDGTPVEGTPTPEDHNTFQPPEPPSTNTGGGLPGFSNVPNAGENQETNADDMYENGNKIGIMD